MPACPATANAELLHNAMRTCTPVRTLLLTLLTLVMSWQPASAIDEPSSDALAGHDELLFVIGVPEELVSSVRGAIRELFGAKVLDTAMRADEPGDLDRTVLQRAAHVVALGRDGCAAVIGLRAGVKVLCTLLYSDAFRTLDCADACDRIEAIVMDQPPGRQARVAATLFPALERFGVLRRASSVRLGDYIELRVFKPDRRLSGQLAELLVGVDAVIVEPRVDIYPADSLRTVLLTAYGWDRPIVGYGPDWVRAGALVSAYSTPNDILADVREVLRQHGGDDETVAARERVPSRFHVAENLAVARSLGLRRAALGIEGRRFRDRDFAP